MSDTKYKALMRLIDVAIPHFDDEEEPRAYTARRQSDTQRRASAAFKIPAGFFGASAEEYALESDDEDHQAVTPPSQQDQPAREEGDDEFFEADPGAATVGLVLCHYHLIAFLRGRIESRFASACRRDQLQGRHTPGVPLQVRSGWLREAPRRCRIPRLRPRVRYGEIRDEGRRQPQVWPKLVRHEKSEIKLSAENRSVSMHINQVGKDPLEFMSSTTGPTNEDLLIVKYTRVQQASPEFQPVYEGIDQNVDVKISTFLFRAAPEPVVTVYDFIMTTFVPQNSGQLEATPPDSPEGESPPPEIVVDADAPAQKIRVLLTLASIQGMAELKISEVFIQLTSFSSPHQR